MQQTKGQAFPIQLIHLLFIFLLFIRIPTPIPRHAGRSQRSPLPKILSDNPINTAKIVLRLPHIVQSRSSCSLLPPLHNLNPRHTRRVYLEPHLDAHTRQMIAQQNCGINSAFPDVDAHACEGFAGVCAHEEDVADPCGFGVLFGE